MLEFIKLFFIIFILVLLIYELIFNKYKTRKNNKKKKKLKNNYPLEVLIMSSFYKIDINKVNYNKFLNILACVSSFDIALIVSIVSLVDNGLLQILLALILVLPIIFLSYYIVSLFYRKKESKWVIIQK